MPAKVLKIPKTLYRAGMAVANKEAGTLRMSISSDEPYRRRDEDGEEYFEVLDHSPGGIDMTRMNAGTSILFNHDNDILLGRQVGHECDGHKMFVDGKISQADDVASYRTKIDEGILVACSVGYEITGPGAYVGKRDGVPIYKFPWCPYESSLVTIEADISVGVGRFRDHKSEDGYTAVPVQGEENSIDETETKPQTVAPAATTQPIKAMPAEIEAPKIDTEAVKKEAQAELRALWKKMDDHVAAIKIPAWREAVALVANKHKEDGSDFDTFKAAAVRTIENLIDERATKLTADGERSHIEVVGERGGSGQRALSVGAQFIRSKEFQERGPQTGRLRSITIDTDMSVIGIRGKAEMAKRAGFNSSDLTAINVAPQQQLIALGMERPTIMDLVSPGTTSAAAIPYPKENTQGTLDGVAVTAGLPQAGMVGERGIKPLWEPDITTDTANVRKIAVTAKVPDEFLADFPGFESFLNARGPAMVDLKAEQQFLYGDGIGNNIKGILTHSGVLTRAYATDWFTTIRKAITDIEKTSFFTVDAIAMHPDDWEVASLEKDLNGQPYAGGPFYIPYGNGVFIEVRTFWGKRVVVTVAVAVGRPVIGCWKLGAQYFMREGMRIETTNSNEDDFKRNLVAVRFEERLALATYRPSCFLEVTGGPART